MYMYLKNRLSNGQTNIYADWPEEILGPVVQNFVSLTLSLSPQFVNYI